MFARALTTWGARSLRGSLSKPLPSSRFLSTAAGTPPIATSLSKDPLPTISEEELINLNRDYKVLVSFAESDYAKNPEQAYVPAPYHLGSKSGQYAVELFEVATANDALQQVCMDLAVLMTHVRGHPDLETAFINASTLEERVFMVLSACQMLQLSPLVNTFLSHLAVEGHLNLLRDIERKFRDNIATFSNYYYVTLTVANLKDQEMVPGREELISVLNLPPNATLDVNLQENPSFVAGYQVSTRSGSFKATLEDDLERLRQAWTKAVSQQLTSKYQYLVDLGVLKPAPSPLASAEH